MNRRGSCWSGFWIFFEHVVAARAGESLVAVGHGDILVFPWLYAQGVEANALLKDRLVDFALPGGTIRRQPRS